MAEKGPSLGYIDNFQTSPKFLQPERLNYIVLKGSESL